MLASPSQCYGSLFARVERTRLDRDGAASCTFGRNRVKCAVLCKLKPGGPGLGCSSFYDRVIPEV